MLTSPGRCCWPVVMFLLSLSLATNAAFANQRVYAHFIVYPHNVSWLPEIQLTFGGSGVPVRTATVETPQQALHAAVPIAPFVPDAWSRGFVLDFTAPNSATLRIRLISDNFAFEGSNANDIRPAHFYFLRVPQEPVGGARLRSEVNEQCDRLAQNLNVPDLLDMYFKCRSLFESASDILNRADTLVQKAFKGWFDASYNLWKASNGTYLFDDRLVSEYEENIRPNVRSNGVMPSESDIRAYLRDVHATEVGHKYNEAEDLRKWHFDDEAFALLCQARENFLRLNLRKDEPPHISLDEHIDRRIRDYGGQVADCPATVTLGF